MTLELTLEKAKELVGQAIEEKGANYAYPGLGGVCVYVENCEPSCLVGAALVNGGVDPMRFIELEINTMGSRDALETLHAHGDIDVSASAKRYFDSLQNSQDNGIPWGEANEKAIEGLTWMTNYPYVDRSDGAWVTLEEYNV